MQNFFNEENVYDINNNSKNNIQNKYPGYPKFNK